jgi:hypothetical protein
MLKFRETLWFKKGELDAREATRAAAGEDDLAMDAVDLLPREDRYRDDGSLTRTDSHTFGVHTGKTRFVGTIQGGSIDAAVAAYAERDMVAEMKRGAAVPLMILGGALLALAVLVATVV